MNRSPSRSPRPEGRRRSRSPGRDRDRHRNRNHGGFRWKDRRRGDDYRQADGEGRLERGYRDKGDRPRSRSPRRDYDGDRYTDRRRDDDRDKGRNGDVEEERLRPPQSEKSRDEGRRDDRKPKLKAKEKKVPVPQSSEPMSVARLSTIEITRL